MVRVRIYPLEEEVPSPRLAAAAGAPAAEGAENGGGPGEDGGGRYQALPPSSSSLEPAAGPGQFSVSASNGETALRLALESQPPPSAPRNLRRGGSGNPQV